MASPDPLPDLPVLTALAGRLRAAGCVFAEEEAAVLLSTGAADLEPLVARRVAGEPLEQVVGWASFCGLRVHVAPGVFVPRRRTEALVRRALPLLAPGGAVVDLCCGTGAVGAALLAAEPSLEVHGCDVDPAAVDCARRNLPPRRVHLGDLYAPLPAELAGRVDVLVCNAPYVPTDAVPLMPPEARDHEHLVALDGGADGLDVQRRVVAGAPSWLAPGGWLLVETSRAQAPGTAALFRAAGLSAEVHTDSDVDGTVVVGRT